MQQLFAQRVDLLGVQRTKQRLESTDQGIQIQRRLGARQRNRVTGTKNGESAGPFLQRQIAVTEQVVVADHRPGAPREGDRVVGGELHPHRRVGVDGDPGDLADLDAGDAHQLARSQIGHVGELGVVGLAVAEAHLPEDGNQQERRQQAYRQEDAEAHHDAPRFSSWLLPAAGLGPIAGPGMH